MTSQLLAGLPCWAMVIIVEYLRPSEAYMRRETKP